MFQKKNFTDASSNLSTVFDTVINKQPVVINRDTCEEVLLIDRDMFKSIVKEFKITGDVYHESNGSFSIYLTQINVVRGGETFEDALKKAIDGLKIYAQDYFERLQLLLNAPNRFEQLPFIMHILLANDDEEIKNMLKLRNAFQSDDLQRYFENTGWIEKKNNGRWYYEKTPYPHS